MSGQFQAHALAVQHEGKIYYVVLDDAVWPIVMSVIASVSKDEKLQLLEAPEGTKMVNFLEAK